MHMPHAADEHPAVIKVDLQATPVVGQLSCGDLSSSQASSEPLAERDVDAYVTNPLCKLTVC